MMVTRSGRFAVEIQRETKFGKANPINLCNAQNQLWAMTPGEAKEIARFLNSCADALIANTLPSSITNTKEG